MRYLDPQGFRYPAHHQACETIDACLFSGEPDAAELTVIADYMRRWRKQLAAQWALLDDPPIRVYIAGPMTGHADHNIPAFLAAAEHLRSLGYIVLSPVEINGETEGEPGQWGPCMKQDLPAVMESDLVALLPGWERSRGAALEQTCAVQVGIPCLPIVQFSTAAGRLPAQPSLKENHHE